MNSIVGKRRYLSDAQSCIKMPSQRPSPLPASSLSDRPFRVVYDIEIINSTCCVHRFTRWTLEMLGKTCSDWGKRHHLTASTALPGAPCGARPYT